MPHIARTKSQALFETRDLQRIPTIFNQPQAAQAPAVRWSSYEITFMARVCMGIFTTVLRNKKISKILTKNTSPYFHSALLVIWPLTYDGPQGTRCKEKQTLQRKTNAANKKVNATNKKWTLQTKKWSLQTKKNRSCVRIMPEGLDRVLLVSRAYEYFPPFFKRPFSLKN